MRMSSVKNKDTAGNEEEEGNKRIQTRAIRQKKNLP